MFASEDSGRGAPETGPVVASQVPKGSKAPEQSLVEPPDETRAASPNVPEKTQASGKLDWVRSHHLREFGAAPTLRKHCREHLGVCRGSMCKGGTCKLATGPSGVRHLVAEVRTWAKPSPRAYEFVL